MKGNIFHEIEKFNLPLETAQSGKGGGSLPKEMSFVEVNPREIQLTALKGCEHRATMILRMFNPTTTEIEGEHFILQGY